RPASQRNFLAANRKRTRWPTPLPTVTLPGEMAARLPSRRPRQGKGSMIKFAIKSALTLAATLALLHPAAALSVTYVAWGNDANDCSNPINDLCRTLSRALAHTDPGGEIIIVGPGFWNSETSITIDKSVRITSDADQALLRPLISGQNATVIHIS